jgi:hypothetical protein
MIWMGVTRYAWRALPEAENVSVPRRRFQGLEERSGAEQDDVAEGR